VGEISSIAPVVRAVGAEVPGHRLLVTTMTATGRRRAAALLPEAEVRPVPLDFKPAMRRFMKTLRPAVTIVAETELWPNMLREASRQGTRLVLVNGRISTRTIKHYLRLRPLVRSMLSQFDLLLMRSPEDADRVRMLGADPGRVVVTGNTKYDALPGPADGAEREGLRESLGLAPREPVIILGSAREGETEILLAALADLDVVPGPALMVAPRHLENVPKVAAALEAAGYAARFSTRLRDGAARLPADGRRAVVVNEMGRLIEYYAAADIAVLGGTFKPHGGHNPLEPASRGAVVVVGPYRDNIADDMDYLASEGAVVSTDGAGLAEALGDLMSDPAGMKAIAARAATAVEGRRGASARCVEAMRSGGILA
jgi:3-deoxy-D-manno-octulosonic-acid transferase